MMKSYYWKGNLIANIYNQFFPILINSNIVPLKAVIYSSMHCETATLTYSITTPFSDNMTIINQYSFSPATYYSPFQFFNQP